MAGKPLIAYTIEAAASAKRLTDFLVSSEDDEILEIARKHGAPTPFVRPVELAGDQIRNIDVVAHALTFMEEKTGLPYDIIMLLQPTSPIRDAKHIDAAVTKLWASEADSLVSVKGPFKKRDPILKKKENGLLVDFSDDPAMRREPFYIYNASIYSVRRNFFIKNRRLISERQVPLVMDAFHSIDVDTQTDFMLAETILEIMARQNDQKDTIL